MTIIQPVIKWSGSKRSQAREIIAFFPKDIDTYYEPFLGGGSILGNLDPKKAVCGDVCESLIQLWNTVKQDPQTVADEYDKRWKTLQDKGHLYYYDVRDSFNQTKSPHDLLFLTRTCVNGLIRFNRQGEFNNSFHLSRKGMVSERLGRIIHQWSTIIKGHRFVHASYVESTKKASDGDFIYLDPPYFHTKGRYFGTIAYDEFLEYLKDLNQRNVKFALSFDGHRGEKSYMVELPKNLYKRHVLLESGNSTFNKVQNKKVESVLESLYLNY
ncbi:DNA adenine methylase [Patescibacteria group bacterium]|nr:DNA adenine methylase [Patescibacteria group bacterium]MBP9709776.1 DNA adenine methylase [Patescibacteria group bacterium]